MVDRATGALHYMVNREEITFNWKRPQNWTFGKIFPRFYSDKQSDYIIEFNKHEQHREHGLQPSAAGTLPSGREVTHSRRSYATKSYAEAYEIYIREAANSDDILDIHKRKADQAMFTIQSGMERYFLDTFFTSGVWAEDLVGGTDFTAWDDDASTPIDDVRKWVDDFKFRNYGFEPTQLNMPYKVARRLSRHPQILAAVTGGATTSLPAFEVNQALVETALGIPIVVGDAITNLGSVEAPNMQYMLDNKMLLSYSPANVGRDMAASGLIYTWSENPTASVDIRGRSFSGPYWEAMDVAEYVKLETDFDMQVVNPDLGTFIDLPLTPEVPTP